MHMSCAGGVDQWVAGETTALRAGPPGGREQGRRRCGGGACRAVTSSTSPRVTSIVGVSSPLTTMDCFSARRTACTFSMRRSAGATPPPATTQGLPRTEAVQGSRGERHAEVIAPDRRRQPRGGRSGRCGGRRCSRRRRRGRRRRRRSVDAPRAGCRAEQRAEHAERHQVPRKRGAPPARPRVGHGQRVRMRRGLSRTWRVSTPHGRCSHQSGWPLASGYGLPVPSTANTQDR